MATLKSDLGRLGSRLRAGFGRRRRLEEELIRAFEELRREIHRANLIQVHRISLEQMDRTIDDPALADARSTLVDISERRRRQLIFANRQYATLLLHYRIDELEWGEFVGHLRVLCRNEVFAEYWARTVEHRRSLPADSLEGRVGGVVDAIIEELADDPEEWWEVVGYPAPAGEGSTGSGTADSAAS
jgi:hypothetical protein